ncbi:MULTISPECIES: SDR family NAD(P)-dependent oxidoreductase [unclassified Streptomyces]|uniref:SDR family NAD(P)-dependent oxidoreductase n=1 Tax=unclassified Streptomyces TaxID=2593676 RepID=UPI002DDB701D|nr:MULTISPECIES: SDR family NAD(P)-dependent oxidoreductase [unclassified Streptomyces]WSA95503.1 SDR family NAD(P)-dependent oxidoreductase [Streptomyces sp. NBC_01795]WSB79919.1 SDR family NAD(P)-dependent oxidoreductase [Streptomyces sp. NBC_01775]WSS40588.1 SDR family NAD(P)-dependent oxidoreductase [Streptomyces sp. NBC_01187]
MTGVSRTALVTGGNRGIGHAVATLLHTRGHRVVITARDGAEARSVARELGEGATAAALDVTDPDSVAKLAAEAGEVDILVNNAGVQLDWGVRPTRADLALVDRTLNVNLLGAWRMAGALVPGMVRRGWGRVVNISSGTGSFTLGIADACPAYSVSKVSLNALTVMLAQETEGTGVLVNAINPGLVRTRMRPDAPQTPREAAEHIVRAATLPDDGPSGVFLRRDAVIGW